MAYWLLLCWSRTFRTHFWRFWWWQFAKGSSKLGHPIGKHGFWYFFHRGQNNHFCSFGIFFRNTKRKLHLSGLSPSHKGCVTISPSQREQNISDMIILQEEETYTISASPIVFFILDSCRITFWWGCQGFWGSSRFWLWFDGREQTGNWEFGRVGHTWYLWYLCCCGRLGRRDWRRIVYLKKIITIMSCEFLNIY